MKTKMIISDLSHEDLVELLSTALYGSNWLGCDYRVGDNMETVKFEDTDTCFEDRTARCLLQGKYIDVYDHYAEDESEDHDSQLEHYWDDDEQCMVYKVSLKDIEDGLSKMLEDGHGWTLECVTRFVRYEDGWFDQSHAEAIMQCVLWGEEIYG